MRKFAFVMVVAMVLLIWPATATAAHGDPLPECGIYVLEDDNDVNNAIVNVNLYNTSAPGNPDSIHVNAKNGWIITDLWVELDDNNQSGWDEHYTPNSASINVNPPGTDIEDFKVRLTKDCYKPCDEQTAQEPVVVWGDWSAWTFNPESGLMERERTGTKTTVYVDAKDGETVCDREVEELYEKETREPETEIIVASDCDGWAIYRIGEGVDGRELLASGDWTDPFADESFFHERLQMRVIEPQECFDDDYRLETNCDGYFLYFVKVGGEQDAEQLIASGEWKKPYKQETVEITVEDHGTFTFKEPKECVQCEGVIWLWLLLDENGVGFGSIRDWGYDGSYDSPSVTSQINCYGRVAANVWGGWVDTCNGWYDSDHRNLDDFYIQERFDVDTLLKLPCGTNCAPSGQ
jgi:hypothetical protein